MAPRARSTKTASWRPCANLRRPDRWSPEHAQVRRPRGSLPASPRTARHFVAKDVALRGDPEHPHRSFRLHPILFRLHLDVEPLLLEVKRLALGCDVLRLHPALASELRQLQLFLAPEALPVARVRGPLRCSPCSAVRPSRERCLDRSASTISAFRGAVHQHSKVLAATGAVPDTVRSVGLPPTRRGRRSRPRAVLLTCRALLRARTRRPGPERRRGPPPARGPAADT